VNNKPDQKVDFLGSLPYFY